MKTEIETAPDRVLREIPSEIQTRRACWMVVDDDEVMRRSLACTLKSRSPAEVSQFRSGVEAFAAFAACPDRFQFVITDLDMPDMNGIELCRRLHEVAPLLKVVLATGNTTTDEGEARQHGFCGLLAKPFPVADLWRIIESVGVLDHAASAEKN
jgi:DNA-binding NtrC family response regulator